MNNLSNKVSNLKTGTTSIGGQIKKNQTKGANTKSKKDKTTYRTTDSDKQWEVVKHNDQIATPKPYKKRLFVNSRLITEKFKEMAKQYSQALAEHREKF